jgi:hypothetical protein
VLRLIAAFATESRYLAIAAFGKPGAVSSLTERGLFLRSQTMTLRPCLPHIIRFSLATIAILALSAAIQASPLSKKLAKGEGWIILNRAFGDLYDYNREGLDSFHCEFSSSLYETGKQTLLKQYRYQDGRHEALDSVRFTFDYSPREFFRIGYAPYSTTGHVDIDNGLLQVISTVMRTAQNALYTWAFYGSPEVARNSFEQPTITESPGLYELSMKNPQTHGSTFKVAIDKRNYKILRTEVLAENVHDIIVPTFEEREGKKVLTAMKITHNKTHTITINFAYHEVDGFLLPLSASIHNKGRITSTNYMMHFMNYEIEGEKKLSSADKEKTGATNVQAD